MNSFRILEHMYIFRFEYEKKKSTYSDTLFLVFQ